MKKIQVDRNDYATKSDVNDMAEYIVDTLGQQLKDIEDKWLTRFDGIVKTLDDLTTDNEVGTFHTRELKVQIENHEKRLTKIEAKN